MMDNKAIVEKARSRMTEAVEGDRDNREDALHDLKFIAGDQWPEEVRTAREADNMAVITINKMPRFVRQVTGDIRKTNPAIKVVPSDEAATPDGAELISGIMRQIEHASDATTVYEGATESAAQCGIGNFRILTEYESDNSFNQHIRIKRIHNPLAVYWDPAAREPTRSDANYCFVTDNMDVEDFEREYKGKLVSDADHDGNTDGLEHWRSGGEVIVAEYFWKEPVDVKIGLMRDGTVVEKPNAAMDVVKTRTAQRHKVMWAKVSGNDVLEGPTEFPSKHIPIVAVVGEEMDIGERVVRTSVIRWAKESGQLYNYFASTEAEIGALQPKAPYMVTPKQVAGLETLWGQANQKNRAYLVYNPDEKAPTPQRVQPPVTSQHAQAGMQRAEDDMKATTGIYDAALGGRSNEQSGVAIRQRQLESDVSTSIYTDNMAKSIERAGNIIVDMIPRVYDTNRTLRVLGDDDQEDMVQVNGQELALTDQGIISQPVNDLTRGEYSVRVTVGPNYSTRRQETAESMMQFVQAFPAAGQVAGDLIAKSMDWPDAEKLADRLKKILPPGMVPPDEMEPEEQQAMQQGMQAQQAEQQAQRAAMEIEMRKANAEATEAEADAEKAQFEVVEAQMNVAAQNGELQAIVAQLVQQQLAEILAGQQGQAPIY